MRTKPCDQAVTAGRKKKAREFYDQARNLRELNEGETGDAFVTLCVHAGIAAADALCCHHLGEHYKGENHAEAVTLLKQVQPDGDDLGRALHTLLSLKTRAGYGHEPATTDMIKKAQRAAEKLLSAVEERLGG
jgi:hypothetical protein